MILGSSLTDCASGSGVSTGAVPISVDKSGTNSDICGVGVATSPGVSGSSGVCSFSSSMSAKGIAFCQSLFGGTWKQTSYNANFRKHYAGIGYKYDAQLDAFVPPKPYPSWTLDDDANWQPPVPAPTDGNMYSWNEANQAWEVVSGT